MLPSESLELLGSLAPENSAALARETFINIGDYRALISIALYDINKLENRKIEVFKKQQLFFQLRVLQKQTDTTKTKMISPFGAFPFPAAHRSFLGTPSGPFSGFPRSQPALPGLQRQNSRVFDEDIKAELDEKHLWEDFHKIGTEMVITKNGR